MPKQLYVTIKDKKSGKSYDMPWNDAVTKPTRDQAKQFIYDQENEGTFSKIGRKAFTPMTTVIGDTMDKYINEPIQQYGEGQPLKMFGYEIAPASKENSWGRTAARYGGAFGEAVGNELDNLTSPGGAALMLAGPLGKGLQAGSGLLRAGRAANAVGRAGTALTYAPKAAGLGAVAHGGYGLTQVDYDQDLTDVMSDLRGPLLETGLGAVGMFGQRSSYQPKPRPAVKPRLQLGSGITPGRPQLPPSNRPFYAGAGGAVSRNMDDVSNLTGVLEGEIIPEIASTGPVITPPPTPRKGLPTPKSYYGDAEGTLYPRLEDISGSVDDIGEAAARLAKTTPKPETAKLEAPVRKPPKSWKSPEPDDVTVHSENLRDPSSAARSKYSQKVLDKIDLETVRNPPPGIGKKALAAVRARIAKNPMLRKVLEQQKGELNIGSITGDFSKGAQKLKLGLGDVRRKALAGIEAAEDRGVFGPAKGAVSNVRKAGAALTGKDITNASFSSFYRSGWAELEKMGKPGEQLARLLKRERIDTGAELADAVKRGTKLVDEKGMPINRTGGLIVKRNKEQINRLINQIKDPEAKAKAEAIVARFSGGERNLNAPYEKGINALKTIQAVTKLSQFAVSNTAGLGTTAMRNSIGTTVKNTWRVMKDYQGALREARESGMLDDMVKSVGGDAGEGGIGKLLNRVYGIEGSEKRLRTIATLSGKSTAKDLFAKLKANPTNKKLYKQLDDLLLEDDMGAVLNQSGLTDKQLKRAGGRMNELTQGLAEGIDLPAQWTGNAAVDLVTQFKKYSFMQTRNMKEAYKANKVKTIATLLTVFPALGEVIGDTKATIKGGVKGFMDEGADKEAIASEIVKAIEARGEVGVDRYLENLGQAWAFGLFGDMFKGAARGPSGLTDTLAGPTAGDLSDIASGAYNLGTKGQGYHLARTAARAIPFVGTAIAGNIQGSYQGRQQRRKRDKRQRKR